MSRNCFYWAELTCATQFEGGAAIAVLAVKAKPPSAVASPRRMQEHSPGSANLDGSARRWPLAYMSLWWSERPMAASVTKETCRQYAAPLSRSHAEGAGAKRRSRVAT